MRAKTSLRLAPVAAVTWGAASVSVHLPDTARVVALALWSASLAVLCAMVIRRRGAAASDRARVPGMAAAVAVVALAAGAAAASHVCLVQPAREALSSSYFGDGRDVVVTALVVGKVEGRGADSLVFDAVATSVAAGPRAHATSAEIVVRVGASDVDDPRGLDIGAVIEARGTASAARPGERAVLQIQASRGVRVMTPSTGPVGIAAELRRALVASARAMPGEGAGLIPGLAVGDTTAVSASLDSAMKESSLSHLTAVSGANCALVVGLAFAGAAALGASRGARVGAGLAALAGFVLLVTPEPSVARAAVMAAIAMVSLLTGRLAAGVAVLALSVTVLLIVDPWLAGSLGFALSVAATASLLLFALPLARGMARVMPRSLALGLAVPLAAQLACGPLLILISPQVPLFGVLANLLAAPAAPIATVVGLAGCIASPIPALQDGLVAVAWLPATWIAATATTTRDLPGDMIPWLGGLPGAATLGAVSAALGLAIALRSGSRRRRVLRAVCVATVCVVVGASSGGALLRGVAGPLTLPGQWSMLACDVGQGDALLLRSAHAVALVDTGPAPEPLAGCLERAGVTRIDLLVLTHFDLDHAGGVAAVVGKADLVLHGPATAADEPLLQDLRAGGSRLIPAARGMSGALGDAGWRVLWPATESKAFPTGNDASVVLDIRGGGIPPSLLLGDLSASPQRALRESGALAPPYSVVKVAHHGSADQDEELYQAVRAAAAVISVGADNDYGHPRDEILDVLARSGTALARTDRNGMVAIWRDADGVEIWRERGRVGGDR